MQTKHFANFSLSPDWDILHTTAMVTKNLPPHNFIWIKGHQDANKPRNSLSFAAQLNCEADDEADAFQQTNHSRPIVPMTPYTMAKLELHGTTVTSHYKYRIREAATLPKYLAYVQKKFAWDDVTNQTIDWPSYKQIVRQCQRTRGTTLMKHLHLLAPTGHIAHRNQSHHEASCPSCACLTEDNDHVFKCPAESRSQWRTKTLKMIHANTGIITQDPILLDVLRDGIQRWLTDQPPIPIADYPFKYSSLIVNQTNIGWSHLFRGRWSHHWKRLHNEYATNKGATGEEADGTRWVRQFGKSFINTWFDLWDIRNKERHGKDAEERLANRRASLTKQLEDLYLLKKKVCDEHRHIFLHDAATHMMMKPNLDGLEDWINTFRPAIERSVKEKLDIRKHFFRQGNPHE